MSGRGWRLTPRGQFWLVELPLCMVAGVLIATAAYFGFSGGM